MESEIITYLDNCATTPISERALEVYCETSRKCYGNPSSPHFVGKTAKLILDESKAAIAEMIGAQPEQIVFTSGGTESNNIALQGRLLCIREKTPRPIVAVSRLEHLSVDGAVSKSAVCCAHLDYYSYEEIIALVGSPNNARNSDIATFMLVCNETGAVLPVAKLSEVFKQLNPHCFIHTDAVQAFGKYSIDVNSLGVDSLSISAHKIHGPKGIGALFIRDRALISNIYKGGKQELGIRPGTQAAPLAASFAAAASDAYSHIVENQKLIGKLRILCIDRIKSVYPDSIVNDAFENSVYILSITIPSLKAPDKLIDFLSLRGVCVSRSSACSYSAFRVLRNLGIPDELCDKTIRIGFSGTSTLSDIYRFEEALRCYQGSEERES